MFVDPGTALKAGLAAYQNQQALRRLAKRVVYLLTRGTLRIAVFGPGGVGKSTLGHFISRGGESIRPEEYKESRGSESYPISSEVVGKLLVPPGQERRIEDYWPELYRQLVQGKSRGIINVVSWGYHSSELAMNEMKEYQPGMKEDEFLEAYTQSRRQREIEIIRELTPRVKDARHKIWMITLATKQDIWWKQREDVKRHYMEGEYAGCINDILKKRGERYFYHEYMSASLVLSNFVSGTRELLAPTAEGYDQNIQWANQSRLLESIRAFAKRKK